MNEVGRVVIVVPNGEARLGGLGNQYVAVAIDKGSDGKLRAESLTRYPNYAYSIIGSACDGRAIETIDGSLTVAGKVVTPEAYLGNWRAALARAVTPDVAAAEHGLIVKLITRGNVNASKGKPIQWTTDPKSGFDEWAADLAHLIKPDADGYFEFELDIRDEQAFRTWETLASYRDHRDNDPRNERGMRIVFQGGGPSVEADGGDSAESHEQEQASLFA